MAIKGYVTFLDKGETDEWKHGKGEELPIVLIACPSLAELIYAKHYTKKLLADHDLQDNEDVHIRFATIEQVKRQSVTAPIWEEA